jgi:hypothetical protein
MDSHIKAREAKNVRQLSLEQSLGIPSNLDQNASESGKPVVTPPDTPPANKRDANATLTGGTREINNKAESK